MTFDQALREFSAACYRAAMPETYPGEGRAKLEAAFSEVQEAYERACIVDDREIDVSLSDLGDTDEDFFDQVLGG